MQQSESKASELPLCVDLDGTLVHTDTLVESALVLLKRNLLYLFAMVGWLLSGKANLKAQIASRVELDVSLLPYNRDLLDWLKTHAAGRKLLLVSATNISVANSVARHLGIFEEVMASSAGHNLSASRKADALVERFGEGGFDYIGNSSDDVPVWSRCRRAVLVNAPAGVTRQAHQVAEVQAQLPRQQALLPALARAMRPHQWSKNLLLFVHLLMAHAWADNALILSTVIAFVAFCLCSSSVYLINDLLDLEADRKHSDKCTRPFAAGTAPLLSGIVLAPLLLLVAFALAALAGSSFLAVLGVYFLLTVAYSFYLKRVVLLDVLVLAMLYTLRIIAGSAVAGMLPSFWLLSFSMFLFASLAMVKRYAELKTMEGDPDAWVSGRGYRASDLSLIANLGVAAGYIAVLVLALYVDSPDVVKLYQDEEWIWLLCPMLMYWIGRIWLLASRGELHQDPVVFAARDRVSYVVLGLAAVAMLIAL